MPWKLEMAQLFDKEAALFFPSGSMNQSNRNKIAHKSG